MGREASITVEQVHSMADTLRAEGLKPTSRLVRERLGNTGSMGTINNFLQRWRAGQHQEQSTPLVMPPILQRAILDFMGAELGAARATLEGVLLDQNKEMADLAGENVRQAEVIEHLQVDMEQLATDKSEITGKAEQLATDLAVAKEDASKERQAAELARIELAKALLRLEAMPRLEADIDAVRLVLDQERKGRILAEQAAAVLAAQKADLDERVGDYKARLNETKQVAENAVDEQKAAQRHAEGLAESLTESRLKLQIAESRLTDALAKLDGVSADPTSGETGVLGRKPSPPSVHASSGEPS